MNTKGKQSFLHGAMILMAATIIVKIVGAIFKIPLGNIIGNTGMGYYNTAYTLFNAIYAIAIAGFPVAVAKMVSEDVALGRYRDARRTFGLSSLLFLATGTIGIVIMLAGAYPYVLMINNPNALWTVLALAPTIFFGCLMSIYRGYYEGLKNMYPTAISQIVEAVVKAVAGLGLTVVIMKLAQASYVNSGNAVFWVSVSGEEEANIIILSFAAAGAVLGVSISTIAGAVYLWIRHRKTGDNISKEDLRRSPAPRPSKVLLKSLIHISIPVCLGALAISLTSLIDGFSVMNRLATALERDASIFAMQYGNLLPTNQEDIPNFLYGAYGLVQTLFNLIPAITTTFGVSALPAVSSAWALRDKKDLKRNIESVLRVTSMIALPAGIGLCILADPIIRLVYFNKIDEAIIAVPMLQVLGVAVIFVSIMTPVNSMLQGVGRADLPVKLMLIGGALKLIINYIFVAIPEFNIRAASWGTAVCYLFIAIASVIILLRIVKTRINLISVFLKPAFASILCGATAWLGYRLLVGLGSNTLATIGSIGLAGIVYAVALILMRGITKDDLLMLPKGEKIAKVLEKRRLIG